MNPRCCQTEDNASVKDFFPKRFTLSGLLQGVGGLLEISYYGSSTTNCFPAYDGNGNIMALVNAADGSVAANYDYAAFGEPIRITGVMARNNPFRFSTKYTDDESDLLYYGYRYDKPSTGTWLTRDPIEEQGGANLYGFVVNSPQNEIDELGLTIGDSFKDWGYHFWRDNFVTAPEWREVMDNWYYERGPNPAYYVGNTDRRNAWIATNPGFRHLLNCWVAAKRGDTVPQSSEWTVRSDGFWWHYGYWGFLGVGNGAGGSAAFDSATHFLGSYDSKVTLVNSDGVTDTLAIDVYNRSHWVSGTRTEGIPIVGAIIIRFGQGAASLMSDHERYMGPEKPSSRGGNMDQHFIFTVKAQHCAKCVLP